MWTANHESFHNLLMVPRPASLTSGSKFSNFLLQNRRLAYCFSAFSFLINLKSCMMNPREPPQNRGYGLAVLLWFSFLPVRPRTAEGFYLRSLPLTSASRWLVLTTHEHVKRVYFRPFSLSVFPFVQ